MALTYCVGLPRKIIVKVGGTSDYIRSLLSNKYVARGGRSTDQYNRITGCGCETETNGYISTKVVIKNQPGFVSCPR